MLLKQDSCRLNDTESFLCTVSCSVDIVECIVFIGKGITPNKHAIFFVFYHYSFALNVHRVHVYYTHVSKRHVSK